MALITDNIELKANFSSMDADYKIESIKSFIDDAEKNILIPWIGQEIYDVISAAYNNADPIAGKKKELLVYLQKAVTHLAFLVLSDSGSFRINDSGFYVISNSNGKPVSDKKMSEFKKGRRESGYNAMEQAIIFLEANINDAAFVAYKDSDAHQAHCAYFINTAVDFTRGYKKVSNSAYLFNRLSDALDRAERMHIKPVLGNAFFTGLKSRILAKTLTAAEKKLIPYITRALANFTMALGLPGLPVEITGQEIVIMSSPAYGNSENVESKAAASPLQISAVVNSAYRDGEFELIELEEYLALNAADFAAYIVPEALEDTDINDPNDPTYFV